MPGPVPKRSSERRRRNKDGQVDTATALPGRVPQPPAEAEWEPLARDWYLSLAESGQAQFYEPSDWQTARILADVLSRNLAGGRLSAALLDTFMSGSARLLVTEAVRGEGAVLRRRDGSTVSVLLERSGGTKAASKGALSIPIAAAKMTPQGPVAFTVASSTLVAHPITLGAIQGGQVEVASGLSADMDIVVDARGLSEGQKVAVDSE